MTDSPHPQHDPFPYEPLRQIAFEYFSNMKPRCSPVSSDGGYEVLCCFNLSDVSKDKAQVGHVPDKKLSQYSRPKMPCLMPPFENGFVPNTECCENSNYLLTAIFKTIKATNPDFRFDNIDIVMHRKTLVTMFYMCLANGRASTFGSMTLQLFRNTLIISFGEEIERKIFWTKPNASHTLRHLCATKPSQDLVRVVKYDLGGLSCMIIHTYDVITQKPNHKKHRKKKKASKRGTAKKHSTGECNTTLLISEVVLKENFFTIYEYSWFGRMESHVVVKVSIDSTSNEMWLQDLTLSPMPAHTEYERREDIQGGLYKVASILNWLRETVITKSSTKWCRLGGPPPSEKDPLVHLAMHEYQPISQALHRMYGEFWDNPVTGYDVAEEEDPGYEEIAECFTNEYLQARAAKDRMQRS